MKTFAGSSGSLNRVEDSIPTPAERLFRAALDL
jgi:hypothetical protein